MYKKYHPWLFILPTGILLLIFTIIPSIMAILLSFTNYNVFEPLKWVGLDNFSRVFLDPKFKSALLNTIYFWILVTPALVIIPIFIAILVNQKLIGVKVYRLVFYFPVLVSVVITAIIWGWLFQSEGVLNYLLSIFGIDPVKWLTSTKLVIPSLAIVTVWQGMGYYMLFYLAALQGISNELYEAAELDGANFFQKHFKITLPLLKPIIFFTAVISTMSAFKEFTLMLTMTEGGPLGASTTVVYLIFESAFRDLNMGYASAMSVILFIVIFILTIVNRKLLDSED